MFVDNSLNHFYYESIYIYSFNRFKKLEKITKVQQKQQRQK